LKIIENSRPGNGGIIYSFANFLNIHNPLVIVDEVHNVSTKKFDNIGILSKDYKADIKRRLELFFYMYIFCSVANTKFAEDIEQFLGMVLRVPCAARRNNEKLNKVYAFVLRSCWTNSVGFLQDKL
jgi:hypothetical protein